eukprot:m.54975 g.54975  ORF g.54975 m.54975 type:complete len:58 (+) comp9228_c0_seq1:342-515(+)
MITRVNSPSHALPTATPARVSSFHSQLASVTRDPATPSANKKAQVPAVHCFDGLTEN